MAEPASDLVRAVRAAICDALEGDCQRNEDGSVTILVEPAARAAIRAVLEAAAAAVEARTPPGSADYSPGWHDGVERSVQKLRAMLAALDG